MKFSTSEKEEPIFAAPSTIAKVKIAHSEKVTKKFFKNVFMLTFVSMARVELMIGILWFLNNVKHMRSWKKEKPFGNTGLKLFTQ